MQFSTNRDGHRCFALLLSLRKLFSFVAVFNSIFQILPHCLKLQELPLQQLANSINKTIIIRIELLAGWVPPHQLKSPPIRCKERCKESGCSELVNLNISGGFYFLFSATQQQKPPKLPVGFIQVQFWSFNYITANDNYSKFLQNLQTITMTTNNPTWSQILNKINSNHQDFSVSAFVLQVGRGEELIHNEYTCIPRYNIVTECCNKQQCEQNIWLQLIMVFKMYLDRGKYSIKLNCGKRYVSIIISMSSRYLSPETEGMRLYQMFDGLV